MRKLATIQKIIDIKPIKDADRIEVASVLGWHVVVKKNEFKVGDLVIFCEIDSLLPMLPVFEFLAKNGTKKILIDGKEIEGYRLKTIRLRKQISQGLCLPIDSFPIELKVQDIWKEGTDVTEKLGIVKWEPVLPANLAGQVKGLFPSFIPKTDETRIQSEPQILKKYKDEVFYTTEKVDGTSCTVFIKDGELNVCSRNLNLKENKDNTYWKVVKELNLKEKLEKTGSKYALQGELIGEGIQQNKLKTKGQTILFFNAYDMSICQYLSYSKFIKLCKKLNISKVPIIDKNYRLPETVDEIVAYTTRKSIINPDIWLEGIVVRPLKEKNDEDLGRLSFKVVNPEFLLNY